MRLNALNSNPLSLQVALAMMAAAPLLSIAEFYPIVGNAEYRRKAAAASGGEFRSLDGDFGDNSITPAYANPALKIFGDKIQVDKAHERRGMDVNSVRAAELAAFARNFGKNFQNYLVNGAVATTGQFSGIKELVVADQKITAATNGLSVTNGNSDTAKTSQQKLIQLIDQLIVSIDGGAQFLLMDALTLSRLTSIARELVVTAPNEFGVLIRTFAGIPMINAGFTSAGVRVIGHAETCGTGTTCTSIYAGRFGEMSDLSIATNVGVDVVDKGLVGVFYEHHVDLDAAPVLLNDKALGRLEGIILG
jgi:hypothetical protein